MNRLMVSEDWPGVQPGDSVDAIDPAFPYGADAHQVTPRLLNSYAG